MVVQRCYTARDELMQGNYSRSGAPSRMKSAGMLLRRMARWPLALIPPQTEVRILRGPLRGKKWIKGAGPNAYWVGTYEVARVGALAEAVTQGSVIYDIGANVGIYTLLSSMRAGPSGAVYAFEPLPRNLEYLRRHVALNRLQNCEVIAEAVGKTPGTAKFSAANWAASMARLDPEKGELAVPVTSVDACIYGDKPLRPPDVLKIDVEGAELDVLQGAERTIEDLHPAIFLEVHGTQLHADCLKLLTAKGYRVEEGYGQLTALRQDGRRSTHNHRAGRV